MDREYRFHDFGFLTPGAFTEAKADPVMCELQASKYQLKLESERRIAVRFREAVAEAKAREDRPALVRLEPVLRYHEERERVMEARRAFWAERLSDLQEEEE